MISAPTQTVPPNYRVEISEHHPYERKNFEPSANYAPCTMRYVCVGAAISRPVVSPVGKQRRRKAPTMQYRTFTNEIRRYYVETWYIAARCAARFPVGIAGRLVAAPTGLKIMKAPRKFPGGTCFGLTLSHRLSYPCGCRKGRCGFGRLWCRCREPGRSRCFGRRLLRWVGGFHSFLHGRWSQCRPCR